EGDPWPSPCTRLHPTMTAMAHRKGHDFLQANAVFATVPPRELTALIDRSRLERYAAREHIFHERDPSEWFCLVVEGQLRIVRDTQGGKEVVLELLGPGEVFGGVAVIERRPYPASAQSVEGTIVLKVPGGPVRALSERYPAVVREMALMIGRR